LSSAHLPARAAHASAAAAMILIEGVGHNDIGKSKKYREMLQAAPR
jgi:hypothetical protein